MKQNLSQRVFWGYICTNILLLLVAFLGRSHFDLVTWMSILQLILAVAVMVWGFRDFLLVGVVFLGLTYLFHFGQSLIITLGFNDIYAHRNVLSRTSYESYVAAELFAMASIFFVGLGYLLVNRFRFQLNVTKKAKIRRFCFPAKELSDVRNAALIIFFISVLPMVYVDVCKILAVVSGDYMDTYGVYSSGFEKLLYVIGQFCRPAITVLLFTYAKEKRNANIITILSTLYYLLMMLSGDRGTGMIYLLGNFFVYFKFVKRLRFLHVIVGVGLCYLLMGFLSVISAFRYWDFTLESFFTIFTLRSADGLLYSFLREFGGTMISLVHAIDYIPSYASHAYGASYLAGFLTISPTIPDAWAEALAPLFSFVRAFPAEVQDSLGGSFLGELYFNFGWWGSVAAVIVGGLVGFVDRELSRRKRPITIAVILVLLPTLLLWTRDFYCTMLFRTFWFAVAIFAYKTLRNKRKAKVAVKMRKRKEDEKRALIITTDKFPKGNAGATRQEALAKLMVQCGYTVDLVGLGESTGFSWQKLLPQIQYVSLRSKKQNLVIRILDRLLFTIRVIRECENRDVYDVILIESVPFGVIRYVKRYAREFGTKILHDSVEWYSPSEYKAGVFSPEYIIKDLNNRFWIDTKFGVIAISSHLKTYYSGKGCACERIPFVHDVQGIQPNKNTDSDKVVFLYAGMMGRKDFLDGFIRAVAKLDEKTKQRVEIRFFGFTREQLCKLGNVDEALLKKLGDQLKIYGRVPRQVVEDNLQEADFALLFRASGERYAKAGFPTKVVESMSYATPMFCNLSSDLGDYLVDGKNSILCKSENTDDIYSALQRALALTDQEKAAMQWEARNCALKHFDYRGYEAELRTLMEGR